MSRKVDAQHLAQLAIEMTGDASEAAELLVAAVVETVRGRVRHSELAVILQHALGPTLRRARLDLVECP